MPQLTILARKYYATLINVLGKVSPCRVVEQDVFRGMIEIGILLKLCKGTEKQRVLYLFNVLISHLWRESRHHYQNTQTDCNYLSREKKTKHSHTEAMEAIE